MDSSGTPVSPAPNADAVVVGRGVYTLTNGTTYFFPLGGQDSRIIGVHLQHDTAIVITSATIEDTCMAEAELTDYDTQAGGWIDEDPSTAFVGTKGANTTATNGVVAVTGGAGGGAMWHIADTGARRTHLKVVVGATGGEVRLGVWGKE
jgi:hypothetical protein